MKLSKMPLKFLVCLCVLVASGEAAKLPNYFTKCKVDDPDISQCIMKNVNEGMEFFTKDTSRVPSFQPLEIPFIHVDVKGNLIIDATDVKVSGLEDCRAIKANFDVEKKHLEVILHSPRVNILSDYKVNGRILILPIRGEGQMNVTYVQPNITYTFDYVWNERGGKKYLAPTNFTFGYDPERVYFYLSNLFNGDQRLGEEMNKFLNENWKDVDNEIGTEVGEGLGKVIDAIVKNFLSKIPSEDLLAS